MPDLSIVIVSWNARSYLVDCLNSIRTTAGVLDHEVIVVDNASRDGSQQAVRDQFPGALLIETGANLGFARGNNVGIARAAGRYLAFVNSDVVILPECLQRLVAFMDANPTVGLAGPRLLNADGTPQPSCRAFPTFRRHLARAVFLNRSLADPAYRGHTAKDVDVLAGSFWIARRDAVERVGVLDERFFFYAEDLDWCVRFRHAGWRVTFVPHAEAVHFGGASSSVEAARFSQEWQKASLQLWRKHYGDVGAGAYMLVSLLHHALRLIANVAACAGPGRSTAARKVRQHWQAVRWICRPSRWTASAS